MQQLKLYSIFYLIIYLVAYIASYISGFRIDWLIMLSICSILWLIGNQLEINISNNMV